MFKKISKISIYIIILLLIIFASTYAILPKSDIKSVWTHTIRIDEDSYGDTIFDSSNLDLKPILDKNIEENLNNVIYINFKVGGAEANSEENIVYDIALVDLALDCNLLSPYLKWKLMKNGEEISSGSFDYKFDTIVNGRLVLTPIQQDLKKYSEDKNTYDYYQFYIWISDSCQSEDLTECIGQAEEQSNLLNRQLNGKIEVELYAKTKEALIRHPSDSLNINTCIVKEDANNDANY